MCLGAKTVSVWLELFPALQIQIPDLHWIITATSITFSYLNSSQTLVCDIATETASYTLQLL